MRLNGVSDIYFNILSLVIKDKGLPTSSVIDGYFAVVCKILMQNFTLLITARD